MRQSTLEPLHKGQVVTVEEVDVTTSGQRRGRLTSGGWVSMEECARIHSQTFLVFSLILESGVMGRLGLEIPRREVKPPPRVAPRRSLGQSQRCRCWSL